MITPLDAALNYLKKGFSLIPVNPANKKPFTKWEEFQKHRPTSDEISLWWKDHPKAMVGIVTGKLSGLCVVDIDEPEFKGTPSILTKQGSRVVFEVPAIDVTYELLRGYQDNPSIPLLDYVAVLRRLRARMLEARDGKRERETGNGYFSK